MTVTPATTPEARILEQLGVDSFDGISYQNIGTAYVVNTKDMRFDFDRNGNFISMQYVGDDSQFVVTNVEEFDWDELDA